MKTKKVLGKPHIWLQETEESGKFDQCDCTLRAEYRQPGTNGSPAFFMCPLHEAAPELLSALKTLLDGIREYGTQGQFDNLSPELLDAGQAIYKAEGRK